MSSRKQHQHRPATRAPHGRPIYTERVGAWVTNAQHRWSRQQGGSAYIRRLIDEDMQRQRAARRRS